MPKALTTAGMVISILLAILFLLDLAIGIPFRQASVIMDITIIVCSLILGYMSWATWKEIT